MTALTGQLENLYGFLGFAGVVSLAILGMLYKIVPFLVWYAAYSQRIGLQKVPALGDLYSERLQVVGFVCYLAGLAITSAGIVPGNALLVRIGSGALAASLVILALNLALILRHLHPRLRPAPAVAPGEKPIPGHLSLKRAPALDRAPARQPI